MTAIVFSTQTDTTGSADGDLVAKKFMGESAELYDAYCSKVAPWKLRFLIDKIPELSKPFRVWGNGLYQPCNHHRYPIKPLHRSLIVNPALHKYVAFQHRQRIFAGIIPNARMMRAAIAKVADTPKPATQNFWVVNLKAFGNL